MTLMLSVSVGSGGGRRVLPGPQWAGRPLGWSLAGLVAVAGGGAKGSSTPLLPPLSLLLLATWMSDDCTCSGHTLSSGQG